MANGIAKIQHYVPQFLLRNFAFGKKHRVHVFDKHFDRVFVSNVKNIACESRYYDFELDGHDLTIEPTLGEIESSAKPIIARILGSDTLRELSPEDFGTLSVFLAIQLIRTPSLRNQIRQIPELMEQRLRGMVEKEEQLAHASEYFEIPSENEIKMMIASGSKDWAEEIAMQFILKSWLLVSTPPGKSFYIGDNPLAMNNSVKQTFYGNIGPSAPGIEIYFPLSPTRALLLLCSSHHLALQNLVSEMKRFRWRRRRKTNCQKFEYASEMLVALQSGDSFVFTPDNVLHFNALQVFNSERYIFSSTEDFHFVKSIIKNHPKARFGRRITVN